VVAVQTEPLFATMDLFRGLARETASRLNMTYPALADERASECVSLFFLERGRFAAT
jgi:hypothetical protein